MARVTDFFVEGTVGNIVFYRRMGKSCARIKRSHIKQTAATKMRATNFGIAARACKGLRSGLQKVMPIPTDRSMQSRFAGSIAKWLGVSNLDELPSSAEVPNLSAFEFMAEGGFRARFKAPLTISQPQDNLVTVSIDAFVPSLQVVAPANTVSLTLIVSVAGCFLKDGSATSSETHTLKIPYNNVEIAAQTLQFNIPTPSQSLTVTAARLIYNQIKNNFLHPIENADFRPAQIINARYKG